MSVVGIGCEIVGGSGSGIVDYGRRIILLGIEMRVIFPSNLLVEGFHCAGV